MSEEASVQAKSSRTARIAQGIGLLAPALTVIGVLLSQLGLPALVGFRLFTLAILLGLIALIVGAVGLFLTRGGVGGRAQALTGVGCGAGMLAIVIIGGAPGAGLPAINDITTDLQDPPTLTARTGEHPNAGRDMSYPPDWIPLVEQAYPDLQPIQLAVAADAAFAACVAQSEAMGFTIVRNDPAARELEAEDVTALFRFVDDVSIRVRPDGAGAVVDIRSKSRDGQGDVGANAARIRAFQEGLAGRI